ncbi:MAG: gephyrin-like molybdotransferase Glp [Alphaproteobacteria bacterium]
MISVAEARKKILDVFAPLAAEDVSLADAMGRVLAVDAISRVTQPPADVSAMDGYAVRAVDVAKVPATLKLIGAAPAGRAFAGKVGAGQAVRIFTGGPVPDDADAVVIQENTDASGDTVIVKEASAQGRHIRPAGQDFRAGDTGLRAGRKLTARDIGLAAAMNLPWLSVRRRPRVAILATGDEVVRPGDPLGPDQIVSSNTWALAAFVRSRGGEAINLGIAADTRDSVIACARGAAGCDLLVTSGGASVGEHDLVQSALGALGLKVEFWKIAMRPGKPLMFGQLGPQVGEAMFLGLPGNPVSALVCALLFLGPALDRMLGLPDAPAATQTALLGNDLRANDGREDYLRATLVREPGGESIATPFATQDSSMLSRLAAADCLIVRAANAPAAKKGERVAIIPLAVAGNGL